MRAIAVSISLFALAACATSVPDSGAGAVQEPFVPEAASVSAQPLDGGSGGEGADIAAEASAVLGLSTAPQPMAEPVGAPMNAMSADASTRADAPAVVVEDGTPVSGASLSDEQSFQAVASRESIQSDADRLAENRAQYVVIAPTEVPQREGGNGASAVKFALATNNVVGQQLYGRTGLFADGRFERNCAKFASGEDAQEAFLNAGGPDRDGQGLDPDGDGFACYFDPAPFRKARDGAVDASQEFNDPAVSGDGSQ